MATEVTMYDYRCTIEKWVDADTADITIDVGFSITTAQRVRVLGINAPELHSRDAIEKARGNAALAYARHLLPEGTVTTVRSTKPGGGDKFGRYLAAFTLQGGSGDYAQAMIDAGHAHAWDGRGERPT